MFRHRNELPVEGELPAFDGATAWLNSGPLTPADLRGQVVLVSFGTYTCINWIRSLPYVRAWADKYAERRADGRRRADARVRVRRRPRQRGPRHQGDGRPLPGRGRQRLRRLAGVRQPLLARSVLRRRPGSDPAPPLRRRRLRAIRDGPPDAPARGRCRRRAGPRAHRARTVSRRRPTGPAWDRRRATSATGAPSASPRPNGVVPDERHVYSAPTGLRRNQWALSGDWRIGSVPALLNEPGGSISYQFHARDLHLVMGPPTAGRPVRFTVRLDGEPPGPAHGIDIDERGNGTADYQRMYQLIRQPGADQRPAVRDRVPRRRRRGVRVHVRMTKEVSPCPSQQPLLR